jgi:hypothetical protein
MPIASEGLRVRHSERRYSFIDIATLVDAANRGLGVEL